MWVVHTARIGGISNFVNTIVNLEIATIVGSFVNKEPRCNTHDNINFSPLSPPPISIMGRRKFIQPQQAMKFVSHHEKFAAIFDRRNGKSIKELIFCPFKLCFSHVKHELYTNSRGFKQVELSLNYLNNKINWLNKNDATLCAHIH